MLVYSKNIFAISGQIFVFGNDFYNYHNNKLRSIIAKHTISVGSLYGIYHVSRLTDILCGDIFIDKDIFYFKGEYHYMCKNINSGEEKCIIKIPKNHDIRFIKFEKFGNYIFAKGNKMMVLYDSKSQKQLLKEIKIEGNVAIHFIEGKNVIFVLLSNLDIYDLSFNKIKSINYNFYPVNRIYASGDIFYFIAIEDNNPTITTLNIAADNEIRSINLANTVIIYTFLHDGKVYLFNTRLEIYIVEYNRGNLTSRKLKFYDFSSFIFVEYIEVVIVNCEIILSVTTLCYDTISYVFRDFKKIYSAQNTRIFVRDNFIFEISQDRSKANILAMNSPKYNFVNLYKYISPADKKKAIHIAAVIRAILLPQIGQSYKYIAAEVCRHFFRNYT